MTAADIITARVAAFRRVLETCAAHGFDPTQVSVSMSATGRVAIHAAPISSDITPDQARVLLADLAPRADIESRHFDEEPAFSSHQAGDFLVYSAFDEEGDR